MLNLFPLLHSLLKQYSSRDLTLFTSYGSSFLTACLHQKDERAQSVNIQISQFSLPPPPVLT
jgi:hypothetical protein